MNIYILADIAVRFNVGYKGYNKTIILDNTKMALNLSTLLYKQGFISAFKVNQKIIIITLKYFSGKPLLKNIKLVSKPSKRVYWTIQKLGLNYNANSIAGIYVISTPLGLLTSTECLLNKNTSGEILLKITLT